MESRFTHMYKRDSSVSMIRVKMSRRRSQIQKENREKMQNVRRHLDHLPELELSVDASVLEKSVLHAQETGQNAKADKGNSAAEERKKLLERFKEKKALQKEKEKRDKEKKGVFKVGLYRPQPLGYLPVNPVVLTTAKATESMQSTRVTRSMKQQQQQPPKLPTQRQAVPKKVKLAPSTRENKTSAPANARGGTAAAEPVVKGPTTRSRAVAKPPSDLGILKTRTANRQPTVPSAGRGKAVHDMTLPAGDTGSVASVECKPADEEVPAVKPSPVKEKKMDEEATVTPTSFAPQGFVFQPPSGLKTFQPAPLSPRSADAFLSPSLCLEAKIESTIQSPPPSDSCAADEAVSTPLSPPPSCLSNPPPAAVSPCVSSPPPPASAPEEPQHNVPYFRAAMAEETERLTGLSELWELRFDDSSIPEEMRDRMRTAVGQARLLMKERFGQFSGLVDDCDLGRGEKITTCTDLQGFWDMVYFQVEDVNKKFSALKEAEARGWQEEAKPVTKQKKVVKKPPVAGSKTGSSAAAKSRLAAVKAAMKAKQAAEKAAAASDDSAPVSDAPANSLPVQTVVFQGGFFQVESPVKVVGASRVRQSGVTLPQSSPCVSRCKTPSRLNRFAVSLSSPNPCMSITSDEGALPTAPPADVPHPAAYTTCTPQRSTEPVHCSPEPLRISPEQHKPILHASPTGASFTEPSQSGHDTSDDPSPIQSDLVNAPADSPMESSESKPHSSPCRSEAELQVCPSEQSDAGTEPEGCIPESNEISGSLQDEGDRPMFAEQNDSLSVSLAADASPVKAHKLSFTLSPSPPKSASPRTEMMEPCVSAPSSPSMMSTTPPRVCGLSPAPSASTIISGSERSVSEKVETTEDPEPENIADFDFERYLQPAARSSLSPVQCMATERFSLGAADAEMESPQPQTEEPVQDVLMTPTGTFCVCTVDQILFFLEGVALHMWSSHVHAFVLILVSAFPTMAPLAFTPWTEQLTNNPLPFTPEQRNRVRQSVCDRDLMMFTPPTNK
ncbi:disks large-associated protein 5 isoform X2 [Salminus brasiliensis]